MKDLAWSVAVGDYDRGPGQVSVSGDEDVECVNVVVSDVVNGEVDEITFKISANDARRLARIMLAALGDT